MSHFWFSLKLFISFVLSLVLLTWIFWHPLSSYSLEWYLKKKIEKGLGGSFQLENIGWHDGALVLSHPKLVSKDLTPLLKEDSTCFEAAKINIDYDCSLRHRKIHLKVNFIDPVFTMDAKTEMLLKALINGKSKKLKFFSLHWEIAIPKGILQSNTLSLPFSLQMASGKEAKGNFRLHFNQSEPDQETLQGTFSANRPGEHTLDLHFHQTPLAKLAKGLAFFNIPLANFEVISGIAQGAAKIKFSKKAAPQFEGELAFSDVTIKDPTLKFESHIPNAVLTFPSTHPHTAERIPGKFALQAPSHLSLGKGCTISTVAGGVCLDEEDFIALNFQGECYHANQPCLFKLTGKIASELEPMAWNLTPQLLNASLESPSGELLTFEYADEIAHVHFSGTPLNLTQLLPNLMEKGIQKEFGKELLTIDAELVKKGASFSVDAQVEVTDQREHGRHLMRVGFDLIKNADPKNSGFGGFALDSGWFIGNDFPITKFIEPFLPNTLFSLDGNVSFQGSFDMSALAVDYHAKSMSFENQFFRLEAASSDDEKDAKQAMAVIGQHTVDFLKKQDSGKLSVKNGCYSDKLNQLICSDISTVISFEDKKIQATQFEGFCCDLFLAGALSLDYTDPRPGNFAVSMALDTFSGTVANFQSLLAKLQLATPLSTLPLQGNIYLANGPHRLAFTFTPQGYELEAAFAGAVTEGIFNIDSDDYALRELSFDFKYDHGAKALSCDNLQGSLFLGMPAEAEEYALIGDHIHFKNLPELQAEFDIVVVGDNNDELLRLMGMTQPETLAKNNKFLHVNVNKQRSHINGTPLTACVLTLNKQFQINYLQLEFTLRLEHLATTLHGFNKTKIWHELGIPAEKWNGLEKNKGACAVHLKYDEKHTDFFFTLKGQNLTFDAQPIQKLLLTGKKQGNVWSIEQLQIDRISIAADITKENQKWKFNFLGLRWDTSCLLGLRGDYFADQKFFSGNIDLLEMDLQALKDIPALTPFVQRCQPRGTLKGTGEMQIFHADQAGWKIDAALNASIASPQLLEMVFDDINHLSCHYVSDQKISFKQLSIPFKNDEINQIPGSAAVSPGSLSIESGEYLFSQNEFCVNNFKFDIPAQKLVKVAKTLHKYFPAHFDDSLERTIYNSKPEGELKGCMQIKRSPQIQMFRLELAQGKYWWLGREHDVSHFALEKSAQNTKAILKYQVERHPCWMFIHSADAKLAHGQLILTDEFADLNSAPDITRSLLVDWIRTPLGFDIQKAVGSFAGLTIDVVKYPLQASFEKSIPLMGRVTVSIDKASNLMNQNILELLHAWQVDRKYNFVGQWQLNKNPKEGLFAFQGNMTGQDIHFNGYEFDLIQADCTYSNHKTELNNLVLKDRAGSLHIDSIQNTYNSNGRWETLMGSCVVTDWQPSLLRAVGQLNSPPSPLIINHLQIEQLQGFADDPYSFIAKGELKFSNHSRKVSHNPLIVIPTEIITRIGLDLSILTPVSGSLYFDIHDKKIFFSRFKDVYSEGRLSKFNLANTSAPSYMDFDGNINLKIRMKHYNLLFKLSELFTFNVEGTFHKPVYSIRKQPRKSRSYVSK